MAHYTFPSHCKHLAIVMRVSISFFMCGLLYMKHVWIYGLSTQFSTFFLHVFRFPTFFPHSLKFPFSLFHPVLTISFKSSTVMAHHKSHFPPSRLNNGYGIFVQIVVLQLSPPASFVLLLLQKKRNLWLTQYKNRVIKNLDIHHGFIQNTDLMS